MDWVLKNIRSISLAFVLAVIVWISAVTASDPDIEKAYPTPIPILIIGQDPSLVPLGEVADSVTLTLRAPRSVMDKLIGNPALIHVFADLSGLNSGIHQVPLNVQIDARPVKVVEVSHPFLDLTLEPLTTKTMKVDLTINGEPAIGYKLGKPEITPSEVVISGPKSIVDQITNIRSQVNVSNARENVETTVQPVPVNGQKQRVEGANLTPDSVQVSIPVIQQGGYRDLAVKVDVAGQVASGYRLTNISVTPPVVTVYSSDPEQVISLPGFVQTEPLDLNNGERNIETRLGLILPKGVETVGDQSVLVQATISPIMSSITLANKPVELIGLDPKFGAQTSPSSVDIILSGPLPLLDQLTTKDVRVFLDLTGLGEGTHQLDPKVEVLIPQISVESVNPTSIEVVIGPPPTPTPTVTKTP